MDTEDTTIKKGFVSMVSFVVTRRRELLSGSTRIAGPLVLAAMCGACASSPTHLGERTVPVGTEVRDALKVARQVSEWTGGKFDVTFAALSDLWKFDYQNQDNSIPDRNDVLRRLPFINYRDLEVDERAGTAFLRRQGMRANLGGVGKGYAVDRA